MIKLKDLITEAPKIKKVKNVSVQYVDADYQGETLHGFRYFKKGPWLYKKDNGEYFAVVITNKNNRYEIQLGKLKNNIQATAAVEKIIKRNLSKFESHHGHNKGKMAKYDAKEIADDAMDVFNMIQETDDLPEWVEAKITISAHNMNSVKDYLTHHKKGKI